MKTTETILIIARRPDGSTFSVSLNDGDNVNLTLAQRRAEVTADIETRGSTVIDVQSIVTELPPKKRKIRDHTVVVTARRTAGGDGGVITFCRSDEELKGGSTGPLTASQWADETWGHATGYTLLSRVDFYTEYEVEE